MRLSTILYNVQKFYRKSDNSLILLLRLKSREKIRMFSLYMYNPEILMTVNLPFAGFCPLVENIDGEAFCCLTKDEVDKLFPLIGQRCKFQSWFNKLRMPEFSFFSEVSITEK